MRRILGELLTQGQLSKTIGKSERSLERWRLEGTGPAFVKAGRKVLYYLQDVEDWLLATRRQSTSSRGRHPSANNDPRTAPSVGKVAEDADASDDKGGMDDETSTRTKQRRAFNSPDTRTTPTSKPSTALRRKVRN